MDRVKVVENLIKDMENIKHRSEKAIDERYVYCIQQGSEDCLIKISDIVQFPDNYEGRTFLLCEKEPRKMTVSDQQIADLIDEYLNNQDEYYSDDWDDALTDCEDLLKQLSEKVNTNLSKRKFYFNSDIEL